MYPTEATVQGFTPDEQEIIHGIRIIIGDQKQTIIEEFDATIDCANIIADESIYRLENKGWPLKVVVSGLEYTDAMNPLVQDYEYLIFSGTGVIQDSLFVMYQTFRFGDLEIIDSYDFAGPSVLSAQCNLTPEQLSQPLINLAAAVVLLQGEFQKYAEAAIEIQDGDSQIDTVDRLRALQEELKSLRGELEKAIRAKTCCAAFQLPVFRVE